MEFTGEFFVPGKTDARCESDHYERYRFARKCCKDKDVLDAACGEGYGSDCISAVAWDITGIDISLNNIKHCVKNYASGNVRFFNMDASKMPFEDTFDVVVSFETIEHTRRWATTIFSMKNALRVGGKLIISSPNRTFYNPGKELHDKPQNPFHTQEFTVQEMVDILSGVGFKNIEIYGQRFRPDLKIPLLNKLYTKLFNPWEHSNSEVKKSRFLSPGYFVIVAEKGE